MCEKCCSSFTTKRYLNDHYIAAHTSAKPYKCDVCHKGFNHISNMKRHKRMHSDEIRYKCRFCSRGFKYINSLQYHEGIHTGEKKVCEKCGFSCRSVATIKAHRCGQKQQSSGSVKKESAVPHSPVTENTEKVNSTQEKSGMAKKIMPDDKSNGDVQFVGLMDGCERGDAGRKSRVAAQRSVSMHTPRKSKQRAIKMIESITEELNEEQKPLLSKLRIKLGGGTSMPKITTTKSRKRGRPRRLKICKLTEDRNETADDGSKDNIELKIENSFSLTAEDPEESVDLTEKDSLATSETDKSQVAGSDQDTQLRVQKDDAKELNGSIQKAASHSSSRETTESSADSPCRQRKESNLNGSVSVKDDALMEDVSIMQEAYGGISSTAASNLTTNSGTLYVARELPNGVLGSGFEDLERCMPVIAQVYSVRE